MTTCLACKATIGDKYHRCPECGHKREPEPLAEDRTDGELKGWAAVYAPRKPANSTERVAAMLQQYAAGNFTAANPWTTPGLSRIWTRGRY